MAKLTAALLVCFAALVGSAEAQQQDRGQSAGERAREAQRRSQSVKKDISTGSRIRGGI